LKDGSRAVLTEFMDRIDVVEDLPRDGLALALEARYDLTGAPGDHEMPIAAGERAIRAAS
jgi:hypothetical protein